MGSVGGMDLNDVDVGLDGAEINLGDDWDWWGCGLRLGWSWFGFLGGWRGCERSNVE